MLLLLVKSSDRHFFQLSFSVSNEPINKSEIPNKISKALESAKEATMSELGSSWYPSGQLYKHYIDTGDPEIFTSLLFCLIQVL